MDRLKGVTIEPLPYNERLTAYIFDVLARGSDEPQPEVPLSQLRLTLASLTALDPHPSDVVLDAGCGNSETSLTIAGRCRKLIGFDISRESIRLAIDRCCFSEVQNVSFAPALLENPTFLKSINIGGVVTKILILRSLHHLPDYLKQQALLRLTAWCPNAERIVIGDIMAFESPESHRNAWEDISYDGGFLDRIESASAHLEMLRRAGWAAEAIRLHPLMGVVVGIKAY